MERIKLIWYAFSLLYIGIGLISPGSQIPGVKLLLVASIVKINLDKFWANFRASQFL